LSPTGIYSSGSWGAERMVVVIVVMVVMVVVWWCGGVVVWVGGWFSKSVCDVMWLDVM
jgi:hypothetical protein